ncbi:MAG: Vps62-related protein, partial [Gammaproteobacteria bacterium]
MINGILLNMGKFKMIWMSLVLLFSLCISAFSAFAVSDTGQIGYSEIEAQERLQIIKELTYRLDTKFSCNLNLNWDDGGSGADLDGYFFIPSVGQSEYIIGGLASQKRTSPKNCVITVSEPTNNPKGTPRLLASPIDWKQIWKDKGSGAKKDGSMWEAIPPDSNYRCLGSIPQLGYNKPNIPNYRCVHKSLTE